METRIKAVWQGSFKEGKGQFNVTDSAINNTAFKPSFAKDNESFTNPEQLLASAHAACYTMTLSYILSENGFSADNQIETTVSLVLNNNVITKSILTVQAKIADITEEQFQNFALKAKEMCPVGNALNVEISLEATLVS